jgi:hypothetical protein
MADVLELKKYSFVKHHCSNQWSWKRWIVEKSKAEFNVATIIDSLSPYTEEAANLHGGCFGKE